MAIVSGEKIYTLYQIIIISGLKLFTTINCEPDTQWFYTQI